MRPEVMRDLMLLQDDGSAAVGVQMAWSYYVLPCLVPASARLREHERAQRVVHLHDIGYGVVRAPAAGRPVCAWRHADLSERATSVCRPALSRSSPRGRDLAG